MFWHSMPSACIAHSQPRYSSSDSLLVYPHIIIGPHSLQDTPARHHFLSKPVTWIGKEADAFFSPAIRTGVMSCYVEVTALLPFQFALGVERMINIFT